MRSALRQQTVRASSTGRLPTRVWFIQDYTHLNIDLRSVIRFIAPKKMRPEIRRRATESKSVNVIVNATTLHQVYLSTDPLLGHLILPIDNSIKIKKSLRRSCCCLGSRRHRAGEGAATPKMLRSPHLTCREPQIGAYTHEGGVCSMHCLV